MKYCVDEVASVVEATSAQITLPSSAVTLVAAANPDRVHLQVRLAVAGSQPPSFGGAGVTASAGYEIASLTNPIVLVGEAARAALYAATVNSAVVHVLEMTRA